jgi:hypothetical protein
MLSIYVVFGRTHRHVVVDIDFLVFEVYECRRTMRIEVGRGSYSGSSRAQ